MTPEMDELGRLAIRLAIDDPERFSTATVGLIRHHGNEQQQADAIRGTFKVIRGREAEPGEEPLPHSLWGLDNFLWKAFKEGLDRHQWLVREPTKKGEPLGPLKQELIREISVSGSPLSMMWYYVFENRKNYECEQLILQV